MQTHRRQDKGEQKASFNFTKAEKYKRTNQQSKKSKRDKKQSSNKDSQAKLKSSYQNIPYRAQRHYVTHGASYTTN